MGLMPLGILPLWILGLFSLALLGGGGYIFWEWCEGVLVGTAYLVSSLAMFALALFGRPLMLALLGKRSSSDDPKPTYGDNSQRIERPDGTNLYVESYGPESAPTILLTHGWGLNSTAWYYLREKLAGRFRLVAWDLPGLGRSTRPKNNDFSLEKMAGDLEAVLESCGSRPVLLLGHSIGGMITLTFCRLFPQHLGSRVHGLVLENTTYTDPVKTSQFSGLLRLLKYPVLYPLMYLQILFSPLMRVMNWMGYMNGTLHLMTHLGQFGGQETAAQLDFATRFNLPDSPAVLARGMIGMFRYDASDVLASIPIPTLIITGGRDRLTRPEVGRTICEGIPNAEQVHIAPAGHLTLLEQDARFCQAVATFGAACLRAEAA